MITQNRQAENIILWILKIGIVFTFFSLFITSFDAFFPFITPRAAYFQVLVEILFGIAVIFVILFPKYRPKFDLISKALVAYLAVTIASTLTSVDPSKSFVGSIERSFGLFHLLHFGALFFVATVALRTKKQWNWILGTSLAISLYAAADLIVPVIFYGQAVPASIAGNPTFLAAYLLFHIFIAFYLFNETTKLPLKILLGAIMLIIAAALVASGIRGAFVGLCIGIFTLVVYFAYKHKEFRIQIIGVFLILAALYTLVEINKESPGLRNNQIVQGVTNFDLNDNTIQARFAMWKMAIAGIKEKPLLGWGRENYNYVFNKHFDKSFEVAKVSEAWEDRTHNIFFDELIYGGLLGLASYLFLLGAIIFTVRKEPILMAMLVSYVVQNLFGVDSLNSMIPFTLFLSFCYFTYNQKKQPQTNETVNKIHSKAFKLIAIPLTVIVVYIALLTTIYPYSGNKSLFQSLIAVNQNDLVQFEKTYEKSKEYLSFFPSYRNEALILLTTSIYPNAGQFAQLSNFQSFSTFIKNDLWKMYESKPQEYRWDITAVQFFNIMAYVNKDITLMDKADQIMSTITTTSPPRNFFNMLAARSAQLRAELTKEIEAAKKDQPAKK